MDPEAVPDLCLLPLWQRLAAENDKLFWRARVDNEVNPWYFARSTGSYRSERWIVFWYGLTEFDEIERCVRSALEMPASLKAKPEASS